MKWGHKYCKKFLDEEKLKNFTPEGRKMIDHINMCLPSKVQRFYKAKRFVNCNKLSIDAFKSQEKCYNEIQSLFCAAFPSNQKAFFEILDKADFSDMNSLKMFTKIMQKCDPPIRLIPI